MYYRGIQAERMIAETNAVFKESQETLLLSISLRISSCRHCLAIEGHFHIRNRDRQLADCGPSCLRKQLCTPLSVLPGCKTLCSATQGNLVLPAASIMAALQYGSFAVVSPPSLWNSPPCNSVLLRLPAASGFHAISSIFFIHGLLC